MKITTLIILVSIFCTSHLCKAQDIKGKYNICNYNYSEKEIPVSQVLKFTENDCGQLIYTDAEGFEYKITEYTFAMSPKNGGNAYFEQANGNMLTNTIKERLKTAKSGDRIVLAQIKCIKKNGTDGLLQGFDFTITP
jgi:hypothetical protein